MIINMVKKRNIIVRNLNDIRQFENVKIFTNKIIGKRPSHNSWPLKLDINNNVIEDMLHVT